MIHACTPRANPARSRLAGFTLIELMIAVAIVGIIAAVAMPSYKTYIRRGQQPEAFNTLSDYRTKMEQYYQDNRNYGSAAAKCADATSASSWNTFPNTLKYFTYTCAADTASGDSTQQSYTITATGNAGTQVASDVYTIDQAGNRKTTVFKGVTLSTAAACWLTTSTTC